MDEVTRSALAELNRAFYTGFADDFARTRQGWPPGFRRILPYLQPADNPQEASPAPGLRLDAGAGSLLDVGCGNGRLLAFLLDRGWRGRYLGIDSSTALLAAAVSSAGGHVVHAARTPAGKNARSDDFSRPGQPRATEVATTNPVVFSAERGYSPEDGGAAEGAPLPQIRFLQADLSAPDWPDRLGGFTPHAIACLAVLHHIPGAACRAGLVARCAALLPPGGVLIVSTWQFAGAPRLRARILPWEVVGLSPEAVEPGDFLLAWGRALPGGQSASAGGQRTAAGRRYCAAIGPDALCALAADAGMAPVETFYADGHEGNLNLYGVFRRPATAT